MLKQRMKYFLIKSWYMKKLTWLTFLLLPFSYLFLAAISLRRSLYRYHLFKSYKPPVPVIVVGNITVGGTGKTPCVIALAIYFKELGYRVGIVSRGYGAKINAPRLVDCNSNPREVGDEPVLIANKTGCPVMVSPKRAQAAKKLYEDYTCNLILSDDGLQHYALDRDIEIALINDDAGLGNQHLLPAGPLREPVARLNEVNYRLRNGGEDNDVEYGMRIMPKGFFSVLDFTVAADQAELSNQPLHAVAGIAHPASFFNLLRVLGFKVIEHHYPDHHPFARQDIQFNDDFRVVMTEKDAIKCRSLANRGQVFLAVEANFSDAFLTTLVSTVKRMSI